MPNESKRSDEEETTLIGPNDPCVVCGEDTGIPMNRSIHLRTHYVQGSGQHCEKCHRDIFGPKIELPPM